MGDSDVVEVVDCRGDLPDDAGDFWLLQSLLFEFLVESASVHVLQHDVQVGLVVETPVHLQDIAVFYAALDADLQGQLVDHHVALNESLGDLFEGEDAVGLAMLH